MLGKIVAEQHQRRKRDVVLLEIRTLVRWIRVRVQQIPTQRSKSTSVADNDNFVNQMDEDKFHRGPVTSHQLEPAVDENVPKKARVARNVFSIRGENCVKFDVNQEVWPNADLAIRATCEGASIDGLPADKVKAGDEREIQQMKDLQLFSWLKETDIPHNKSILLTGWARRLKESEVRSRCVLKEFATTVGDDVFAPPPSLFVSVRTDAACGIAESGECVCFRASRLIL